MEPPNRSIFDVPANKMEDRLVAATYGALHKNIKDGVTQNIVGCGLTWHPRLEVFCTQGSSTARELAFDTLKKGKNLF